MTTISLTRTSAETKKIQQVLRGIAANFHIKYKATTNFNYEIEVDKDFAHVVRRISKIDMRKKNVDDKIRIIENDIEEVYRNCENRLDNILQDFN